VPSDGRVRRQWWWISPSPNIAKEMHVGQTPPDPRTIIGDFAGAGPGVPRSSGGAAASTMWADWGNPVRMLITHLKQEAPEALSTRLRWIWVTGGLLARQAKARFLMRLRPSRPPRSTSPRSVKLQGGDPLSLKAFWVNTGCAQISAAEFQKLFTTARHSPGTTGANSSSTTPSLRKPC